MNQNLDKKIAIIIPAYNVEKYIRECLNSVINQTYKNIEIIVVNDGSNDATLQIIKEIAKQDSRIKVIEQENQGVAEARNNALKNIDSEYVLFLDSDDWLDSDTCEETLKVALQEKADIVMFGYVREYDDNSLTKAGFDDEKIIYKGEEVKAKLHRRLFGPLNEELKYPEKLNVLAPVCMKLYKTEVLKDLSFVDINELGLCEDGYFNIFAFEKANTAVFIKKYFYHYRKIIAEGSLTQKKDNQIFEKTKKFYNQLIKLVNEKKYSQEYKKASENRLAISLIENVITIVNSRNEVYKSIKRILNDKEYKGACSNLEIKCMPIHWKVFFLCAKLKFTFGVYMLSKIIVKLIDKK